MFLVKFVNYIYIFFLAYGGFTGEFIVVHMLYLFGFFLVKSSQGK